MKSKILIPVLIVALIGGMLWVSSFVNRMLYPELYMPKVPPTNQHTHDKNHQESKEEPSAAYFEPVHIAIVKTNRGTFKIALYEKDAPITTKNFIDLVNRGFYKGIKFHRVEDWVVQCGDPTGTGAGGSGKKIKLETKEGLDFNKPYAVGMAREPNDPNSATSQFFITKIAARNLNGQYAMFGRVIQGQEVIDRIQKGDKILDIKLSKPTGSDFAITLKIEKPIPDPRDKEK